jgi:PPK2 family polyphosphate:nucleotide phosphotransferase
MTMAQSFIIDHPQTIDLDKYDSDDTGGLSKTEVTKILPTLEKRLGELQELLYAAAQHSVLIILQGMDTSGKDGTVSHVMSHINPAGCHVWSFKVPSTEELAHDFLWRIHNKAPIKGMMAIFNRSHYESVLVERVHSLVPAEIWRARYEQINDFERLLAHNDTIILKFFLHISKDEQKLRLIDREKEASKSWKLSVGDWQERKHWKDYMEAYTDALGKCGTKEAPWYIIPANKKWYRNYLIAHTIVERLAPLIKHWHNDLEQRGQQALAELHAMRHNSNEDAQ